MKPAYLLFGLAGTSAAILLDAAPSKALVYIDFIPLSPTQTRIQASGTINPSLLGASVAANIGVSPSAPTNSSRISLNNDDVRFNYNSTTVTETGRRYVISGISNPFTGTSSNASWTGTTPVNNPPLYLRFGAFMDLWLPNSFTGGATADNQVKNVNGFFDVDLSLAQIGLASPTISFTSGTEQIILRSDPAQVPGPVPILGVAALFGYSRNLRKRIQRSTPSRIA